MIRFLVVALATIFLSMFSSDRAKADDDLGCAQDAAQNFEDCLSGAADADLCREEYNEGLQACRQLYEGASH